MWRIDADQIKGKVVRPAPMGTEAHPMRCVVYEDAESSMALFSFVTMKDVILTGGHHDSA